MVAHFNASTYAQSNDGIAALRCRDTPSGYRNVYRAGRGRDGVTIWRARVKLGGRLYTLPGSRSPDVRVCARAVAAWYAEQFGANWLVLAKSNQRRRNTSQVRYSERYGGYVATAWVLGRREEVWELKRLSRNRWRATESLAVFSSAAEARTGLRRYLCLRYGLFAECVLWRGAA